MNIYQQEYAERRNWSLAALLTTLCSAVLLSLVLSSCHNPYEIAKKRFANEVAETTYVQVTTTIPRDSVMLVMDTTRVHERVIEHVKQGRASLTIIKEPTNTTIVANCDSMTKAQQLAVAHQSQYWGVDPQYKEDAEDAEANAHEWKTAFWALLALCGVMAGAYFLVYRIRLYITKKDGANS